MGNPSNVEALGEYSAVCFLYARYIYDQLKIPIGLVKAEVGGTEIEAWSPSYSLDGCGITVNPQNVILTQQVMLQTFGIAIQFYTIAKSTH